MFFGANYYRKQKLFYIQFSKEVEGTVISWSTYTKIVNHKKQIRYSLKIQATNGSVHTIDTTNSKAKKYKENSAVIILIPPNSNSDKDNDYPIILKDDIHYYSMISAFIYIVGIFCSLGVLFLIYLRIIELFD